VKNGALLGTKRGMEDTEYLERAGSYERTSAVRKEHKAFTPSDNGGRRSGIERRRFSYSAHIPERRKGIDRRCGEDRRCGKSVNGDERALENMTDAMDASRNADRRSFVRPLTFP